MKVRIILIAFFLTTLITSFIQSDKQTKMVYDFSKSSDLKRWKVVNDVVMGGTSKSSISINNAGNASFKGNVSLENNGGFASIRLTLNKIEIKDQSTLAIRLKGDSKKYQFRLKSESSDYYSFINIFKTSGDWETIKIKLDELYPSYRGMRLKEPNFSASSFEEISFLISNKKNESFHLEIDKIEIY